MRKDFLILLVFTMFLVLASCNLGSNQKEAITYQYYSRDDNGDFYLKEKMNCYLNNSVLSCEAFYYENKTLTESKEWSLDYSYTYYNMINPVGDINRNYIITHYKDNKGSETEEFNATISENSITYTDLSGVSYTYTLDGKKVIKVEKIENNNVLTLEYTYEADKVTAKATNSAQPTSHIIYTIFLKAGKTESLSVKSYYQNVLYKEAKYPYIDGILTYTKILDASYSYKDDGTIDYSIIKTYELDSNNDVLNCIDVRLDSLGEYSSYIFNQYVYEKDEFGNVTKKILKSYDQDDELLGSTDIETYTYNYLDKYNSYTRTNSKGSIDLEVHFDKSGNMSTMFEYSILTSGTLTTAYLYEYNKKEVSKKTIGYYLNTKEYSPYEKISTIFYNLDAELLDYELFLS